MSEGIEIAKAVYRAYVAKDRATIERLIATDFLFTSPLDNGLDRETYFARCWPNSEHSEAFEFVHLIEDGPRVFVTYECVASGKRFRNTEILTVANGRLTAAEVYFGWSLPHPAAEGSFVEEER